MGRLRLKFTGVRKRLLISSRHAIACEEQKIGGSTAVALQDTYCCDDTAAEDHSRVLWGVFARVLTGRLAHASTDLPFSDDELTPNREEQNVVRVGRS